ncbi:MAG: SDR family NAD(P)-dependent oxidoreductase [Alphaproteobacteria bacterium]
MSDIGIVIGVGASNGLGAAVARRYAVGGLRVLVAGRTAAKVGQVAEEIRAAGGTAEPRVCDVTDAAQVDALFAGASDPVKAVVYNAGNNRRIAFADLDAATFEDFWRVGCLGGFHTAKAAIPSLLKAGGGSLIFTGASASMRGRPYFAHFAAAKAGLRSLAQAVAREYGSQGVHVGHVVVDGVIDGEIVRNRLASYLEQLGEDGALNPDDMADAFWNLHTQPRSTWTHEIDLRPFKETW